MTPNEPEILKARQVAEMLQIDYKTLLRLLDDGVIPAVRAGTSWRVAKSAVLAALGLDPDGKPPNKS